MRLFLEAADSVLVKRYKLTRLGKHYAQAIIDDRIMQKEIAMLQALGTSLTEEAIEQLYL